MYKDSMGITERIAEYRAQQEADRLRRNEERDEPSRRIVQEQIHSLYFEVSDKFLENLPSAIAIQQRLFSELEEIGLIATVQEIAKTFGPKFLNYYQYEVHNRRGEYDIPRPSVFPLGTNDDDKEWIASTEDLAMTETGTVQDPKSLRIVLTKFVDHQFDEYLDEKVLIAYREDKTLTIEGESTTFKGKAEVGKVDRSVLEDSLANAIVNPRLRRPFPSRLRFPMPQLHPNRLSEIQRDLGV